MQDVVITLKNPIKHGSELIDSLTFKGPLKGKHMKGLPLTINYDGLFVLAGRLCGQPPSVMDEITDEDITTVLGTVSDFLPFGQKTGV